MLLKAVSLSFADWYEKSFMAFTAWWLWYNGIILVYDKV